MNLMIIRVYNNTETETIAMNKLMQSPTIYRKNIKGVLTCFCIFVILNQAIAQHLKPADKIVLATKVMGLLDHYEPQVFSGSFNLNDQFAKNYDQFESIDDKEKLNDYLMNLISPLKLSASSVDLGIRNSIFQGDLTTLKAFRKVNVEDYPLQPDFDWINNDLLSESMQNTLLNVLINYHPKKRVALKTKGPTISHIEEFSIPSERERAYYTLGLMKFWNGIEYYFPYKYLMDVKWSEVLEREHSRFEKMEDRKAYIYNIQILASYLDDSHGFVSINDYQKWAFGFGNWAAFPVQVSLLNDTIFIKNVAESAAKLGLTTGQIISHINNVDAKTYLDSLSRTIIASNKTDSIRQLGNMVLGLFNHPEMSDSVATITVNQQVFEIKAEKVYYSNYNKHFNIETKENDFKKIINDATGYINITKLNGKKVNKAFKEFKDKPNLILDLRGYPQSSLIMYMAKNLSKKAKHFATYYYPEYDLPGYFKNSHKKVSYYVSNKVDFGLLALSSTKGKVFPTFRKPYQGNIYVLIDERAISYAETIGMMIKSYRPDAKFIGRQTNGANGNVTEIPLPFNISVSISGLDWHYANGDQLQRIGIQPNIMVERSYEEVVMGDDKIMETAARLTNK